MIEFLRRNLWASAFLFVIRLYLGYTWISAGLGKVSGGSFDASGFLNGALAKATGERPIVQDWWASFLKHVALPNVELFSIMVQWGEILVGAGLLLGVLTKTAAFFGIVMNMSFLLSGTISGSPIMIILSMFVLVAYTNAGRIGLDYYVFSKLRSRSNTNSDRSPHSSAAPSA
nr:DoxX family protein [Paenibacillus sp. ACRRX]